MEKIKTIFDRDWEGNRGVIDRYVDPKLPECLNAAVATEKLDGTNVRLTVRNHQLVRLEKRRNPTKAQKAEDIVEPWYVEADEYNPQDKHIRSAARNTPLGEIPDGEWSGEAVGLRIQGNPLELESVTVCLFSCGKAPLLPDAPVSYEELRAWLPSRMSEAGTGPIEGVVWHDGHGPAWKIKTKDFKTRTA